jgi:hypothetical protein
LLTIQNTEVTGLTFSPTPVASGATTTGTVTISPAATDGGTVVNLTLSAGNAGDLVTTFPMSVTVPAGTTTTTFTVTAGTVSTAGPETFTVLATVGGGTPFSGSFVVTPLTLASLSVSPDDVFGGTVITQGGTVTLSAPAPAGGTVVFLNSDTPSAASVPASITIPAGSTSASFDVTTFAVTSVANVTLGASLVPIDANDPPQVTAALEVDPVGVTGITFTPDEVRGGQNVNCTITLSSASSSDTFVTITQSDSDFLNILGTVDVPAGQTSVTFPCTTNPVSRNATTEVTASLNGTSANATVTVTR